MPADIELYDLLVSHARGEREDIHTAIPGRVTAYNPTTQLADVQPMVKMPQFDEDGNRIDPVSFPVLPAVPVRWPQAGGYAFVLPMAPGDFVWIEFAESGTGEFRATGQESEPFDVSRHTVTYPYCSPGAPPDTHAMSDAQVTGGAVAMFGKLGTPHQVIVTSSGISLGAGASDFVALASLVDQKFADFATWVKTGLAPAGLAGGLVTYATSAPTEGTASAEVKCK